MSKLSTIFTANYYSFYKISEPERFVSVFHWHYRDIYSSKKKILIHHIMQSITVQTERQISDIFAGTME